MTKRGKVFNNVCEQEIQEINEKPQKSKILKKSYCQRLFPPKVQLATEITGKELLRARTQEREREMMN